MWLLSTMVLKLFVIIVEIIIILLSDWGFTHLRRCQGRNRFLDVSFGCKLVYKAYLRDYSGGDATYY